jgi:dinuclear metal center YbgI/SA1388 family protein
LVLTTKLKSVNIKEVIDALERFAPLPLQEGWDNAGLQVGLTEAEVSGALLCLDVTEAVVNEALRLGCNLIVSHHPLIFHKLAHITADDYVQRIVMKAIKNDIVIASMHTNMDNARGGVNFKMAEKLGLTNVQFLQPRTVDGVECGSGVMGEWAEPIAADDFIVKVKKTFGVECVQCNQLLRRGIRRVALCGGAGSFLLDDAAAAGADAFITGEMHYHEFFGREQQIQIAVIGHYQSEQYTNEIFKTIIEEKCKGVKCYLTQTCTNPIIYF